ncbi:MAG: glycogen/starch synthase [Sedimentisphaerales bacterium]|nr:glycogen/starch synthase [Sedimentisphaerales bacterium]NLT76298.1 glycosyltransferase [Planctomycetota bacterium]
MPLVTFCLRMHEPFRLDPEGTSFLWDERNRSTFAQHAERCYLPTVGLLTDLVKTHVDFKVSYCLSGTFLEQAELYEPQVIGALADSFNAGRHTRQVELLEQTYHHSLTSFFADKEKTEFKQQVSLHRQKIHDFFGVRPTAFANTDLLYNNDFANLVADMGYKAVLCEPCQKMIDGRTGEPIAANTVFRAKGRNNRARKLAVLPRNAVLSRELTGRLGTESLTATEYAARLSEGRGEVVLLVCDFPLIEAGTPAYERMEAFWRGLYEEFAQRVDLMAANPSEVAEWFQITESPMIDCPCPTCPCETDGQVYGPVPLRSQAQRVLFSRIETMEEQASVAGGELLRKYRYLTTSDHWRYLEAADTTQNGPCETASPYDSPATAAFALTRATDELSYAIRNFNIRQRSDQTAVIIITPETARLPSEGMGQFARYVSGKSGGLGEVISALCQGLAERRIPVHLITMNLTRRFREEAGLSETEWIQKRHQLNPENVHLVSSSIFEGYRSAYDGWPLANAAEFQRQIVNTYIKEIRSKYEGRAILHTNDWMAGGVAMAYAALRRIPILHTVHNTHTGHIPLEMLYGVNLQKLWDALYISIDQQKRCVDAHATAIKNATKVSYVGEKFLKEVVEDYFLDRPIIPWSVREETKIKFRDRRACVIPNGISPDVFPETQPENPDPDAPGLAKRFGPFDNVLAAKRLNLLKFQHKMGLNIDAGALLLYWPSRLDPMQKGIELLEEIAGGFVYQHPDVQIAVVADPVGGDNTHAEIMGRIACASGGRIAYRRFDQDLSMLGYAAAADVFGASLYEPFGQIDVVGNIHGATTTNRDTGGYSDKISQLSLRAWGAPIDSGNGVLFRNYDTGGLWWGLSKAVEHLRYFKNHPREWEKQMRRIMQHARKTWSLDNMVARYITAYEELNEGKPLV